MTTSRIKKSTADMCNGIATILLKKEMLISDDISQSELQAMHKGLLKHKVQLVQLQLLRVGSFGRFMALDLLDRVTNIGNALSSNLDKMTEQERNRYKHFLKTELRKVDQQQTQGSNNINKKGD
jgi:hypothetical protein